MAAELKLTKITPVTGTDIDVEGNLVIGTDAVPKALEVKGNITAGVDIDVTGDITANKVTVTGTPSADSDLATIGYVTSVSSLTNYITGYEISNNVSNPTTDVDIATGICRDSTDATVIELSSTITKQLDAAWAVGNNQGGLDTGTVANDTWYYLFAIYNTSTESTDVLFSTNPTSPTMPSGYDYKRRIRGAVLTDGSANILGFYQYEDTFWFADMITDLNTGSPATSKTNVTVSVPAILCIGIFHAYAENGSTTYVNFFGYNESDRAAVTQDADLMAESGAPDTLEFTRICFNSTLAYRCEDASVSNFRIQTKGFIDKAQA